jgi:hypothetical protein
MPPSGSEGNIVCYPPSPLPSPASGRGGRNIGFFTPLAEFVSEETAMKNYLNSPFMASLMALRGGSEPDKTEG